MELNNIKTKDISWGEAASALNENFGKIGTDVEKIKNATIKNKGYYASVADLTSAFPSAQIGDYAYVGSQAPYQTWHWTIEGWEKLNDDGGNINVDLNNYYPKPDIDEKLADLASEVDSITQVFETIENPDYIEAEVDSEGKIFSAVTLNSKKEFLKVEFENEVECKKSFHADKLNTKEAVIAGGEIYEHDDMEYVLIECDNHGHIIRSVRRDGTNHFPKIELPIINNAFTTISTLNQGTNLSNRKNFSLYKIDADGNNMLVYSDTSYANISIKDIKLSPNKRCYYYIKLNVISLENDGVYAQFSNFFNWHKEALRLGENVYFSHVDSNSAYTLNDYIQFAPIGSNRESRQIATIDLECIAFVEVDKNVVLTQAQVEDVVANKGIYAAKYSLVSINKGDILSARKWVLLGDSITAQGKFIAPAKDELNIGSTLNLGVGGLTLSDNGNSGMCYNDYLSQIPSDAYLITVMGGTNDFSQNIPLGDYSSSDKREYCGALNYIIDYITENYPQSRLVMLAPPLGVNWGYFPNTDGVLNGLGISTIDYANACEAVCKKRGIPCVNMSSLLGWTAKNISAYVVNDGGDGYNAAYFHPTQIGGNRMAAVLVGFLKSIMPLSRNDI